MAEHCMFGPLSTMTLDVLNVSFQTSLVPNNVVERFNLPEMPPSIHNVAHKLQLRDLSGRVTFPGVESFRQVDSQGHSYEYMYMIRSDRMRTELIARAREVPER